MRRFFFPLVCSFWFGGLHAQLPPQLPPVTVLEEQIRRANDYFIANFPVGNAWWDRATYAVGNVEAAKLLEEPAYWARAETWAIQNNWSTTRNWAPRLHADHHLAFQVYQDLYEDHPVPDRLTQTRRNLQDLIDNVSWNDPHSVNNNAKDDWWWIDAFYMAGPSLARMANLDDNEAFRLQMWEMYLWMKDTRGLFNPDDGLWFRDQTQFPPDVVSSNGQPVYWSRGNGWVFMGLARVLDALPPDHAYRAEFETMLQIMAAALKPLQGADGFWRSNLLHPEQYPGPETSGTALFTAGMAWGIRNGLLDDAEYGPVIALAWEGMTTLALQESGRVGYIQNIGWDPRPAEPNETHDFGVGAFLQAGVELIRLQGGGPPPVSPRIRGPRTLTLAANQFETVTPLHVLDSQLREGSIQHVTWWTGNIFLGEGLEAGLLLPAGIHDIRAELLHSGGVTYPAWFTVEVLNALDVLPATATASAWQDPNVPQNVLDGNLSTRWSAEGPGEWIQFDLGEPRTVNEVAMAFHQGDQRRAFFAIAVSNNGSDWTPVLTGQESSGTTFGAERFIFPEQNVRYLRITGQGNSSNTWNSYTAVEIRRRQTEPAGGTENGLPVAWELSRTGATGADAQILQAKGMSLMGDYIAGTDPADPDSLPAVAVTPTAGGPQLAFHAPAAFGPGYAGLTRWFRVEQTPSLTDPDWRPVPGLDPVPGDNLRQTVVLPAPEQPMFYRTRTWLQPAGTAALSHP